MNPLTVHLPQEIVPKCFSILSLTIGWAGYFALFFFKNTYFTYILYMYLLYLQLRVPFIFIIGIRAPLSIYPNIQIELLITRIFFR